jgi:hypothetical protein
VATNKSTRIRSKKSHKIKIKPHLFLNHLMEAMIKYSNLNTPVFSYISTLSVSQLQTTGENAKNLRRATRLPNKC